MIETIRARFETTKTDLRMVSLAASEMGTSGGKTRVSLQFMIFLWVSWGLSEQKGG